MTHTPEKWYAGYGHVFTVIGEDQVKIIAEHIRDEKTAHQIKAIPDMLEALETIMDIGDKACRDIARAAIKKARGEA